MRAITLLTFLPLIAVADDIAKVKCTEDSVCFIGCYDRAGDQSVQVSQLFNAAGDIDDPGMLKSGWVRLNPSQRYIEWVESNSYEVFWLPEDLEYCVIAGGNL